MLKSLEHNKNKKSRNKSNNHSNVGEMKQNDQRNQFLPSKLTNSNSSGKIKVIKKHKSIKRSRVEESKFMKTPKLTKESQLVSCIRNISPYLKNKIVESDMHKSNIRTHNPSLILDTRSPSIVSWDRDAIFDTNLPVFNSKSQQKSHLREKVRVRRKINIRNETHLTTLPAITTEPNLQIVGQYKSKLVSQNLHWK